MAEINYDVLEEGDAITADSLNSRFTAVRDGVNVLENYALSTGCLRSEHLPAVAGLIDTKVVGSAFSASPAYTEKWTYAISGWNLDLGVPTVCWAIIQEGVAPTDPRLVIDIPPGDNLYLGTENTSGGTLTDRYAGILVLLNVHFINSSLLTIPPHSADNYPMGMVVAIQFKQGIHWFTVKQSLRLCSYRAGGMLLGSQAQRNLSGVYQDVPVRTLITADQLEDAKAAADLQGWSDVGKAYRVLGIRAVAACYADVLRDDPTYVNTVSVTLREGRLTALKLRASGLAGGA